MGWEQEKQNYCQIYSSLTCHGWTVWTINMDGVRHVYTSTLILDWKKKGAISNIIPRDIMLVENNQD